MFAFKLSRAQIITHKLNRLTNALTRVGAIVPMDRHTSAMIQVHLLSLIFSFAHSLPFTTTMELSLSDARFHTIAVTECVNWGKMCKQMTDFSNSVLFIFPLSTCHPYDKFLTYTILCDVNESAN